MYYEAIHIHDKRAIVESVLAIPLFLSLVLLPPAPARFQADPSVYDINFLPRIF